MDKENFIQLIDKYLEGKASEAEGKLVDEYLARMEMAGTTELAREQEVDLHDKIWANIKNATAAEPAKLVSMAWYKSKVFKIGATVAAACAILFFVWQFNPTSSDQGNMRTITVEQGQPIQKQILADGSLVWVKANSSLTYPVAFDGDNREVILAGEALFEVAKDANHPFVVKAGDLNVQVLGTSFNINNAADQNIAEVAVLTGKVWVDAKGNADTSKVIILPFRKVQLNKLTGQMLQGQFEHAAIYTAGTEYNMSFVNAPIDSIGKRIGEKFDVVVLTDVPKGIDCRVSGDFTDQSLSHTLDFLCKSLQATYTQKQDTIRIIGVKCK